jgi:Conserved TM helix
MNYELVLLESMKTMCAEVASFLPRFFLAVAVFLIGWLLARLLRYALNKACHMIRLDIAAEKAGVDEFLKQGGISHKTVPLFANIIYWFAVIVVIFSALNVVGMESAGEIVNQIIYYIPNVFVAMVILLVGSTVASFIKGVVFAYLKNVGMHGAHTISMLGQYAITFFSAFLALHQLKIGGEILTSAFQIAFGAVCLASALAFGLGGRDLAARYLEKISKD